ncbi:MAG: ribonuclease HIII [Candidatus Cloacimonetes bacterium]|nr:ribonuclease HIII [Candidatus Cloacimonadota bacterium]
MIKELLDEYARLSSLCEKNSLKITDEKEINYGFQLTLLSSEQEISLRIYFSKKKRISHVIGGSPKNPLRTVLEKLLYQTSKADPFDHNWDIWIGTDESGKGDFFGPLVTAGFVCKKVMIPYLKQIGIRDSKLIKDKEIIQIAKSIYAKFGYFIEVVILAPEKYNELYEKFRSQNKKLNELLAWMHSRVIVNAYQKTKFDGALIDQFAKQKIFKNSLKDLSKIQIKTVVRGESDIAVATASIIARYHFLESMKNMSDKYRLKFPKGASQGVIDFGKDFIDSYGKAEIDKVAKTHFVTMKKIQSESK